MAEIPCHAVKSPFEAVHQPGDPQLWASAASCNTSGLAERDLAGSAAKSKGLQREDNIFYWKPSKRQQEKKGSVHTPDTRPAHWAVCPSAQAGWPKPREAQGISQRKLQNSQWMAQTQMQAPSS